MSFATHDGMGRSARAERLAGDGGGQRRASPGKSNALLQEFSDSIATI
jgi:hypothetical protein